MLRLATLLAIAATAVLVDAATGDTLYAQPDPGVVVADLNGDGRLDIASVRGKTLAVQLGHGDGTFAAAAETAIGTSAVELTAGDVNGDGAPDLVGLGVGTVIPLLNAGDGRFSKAPSVTVSKTASSVALADFTGDGELDAALGDSKRRSVDVLPGGGDGGFAAPIATATPANVPTRLQVGDFDGDGRPDLATRRTLLFGLGDGHFTLEPNPLPTSHAQAIGDLNGDGRADLVGVNTVDVTATVVLAAADGGFAPAQIYATGRGPVAVTVGDFTGDGRADIITGDFLANRYSVLPGTGDGSFGAAVEYSKPPPHPIAAFVAGDFDGDARTDLLMGTTGEAKNVFTAAASRPAPTAILPKAKRAAPKKRFVKGGCRPPRESETIKATRRARMYNAVSGLYGCLVNRGRLVRLLAERNDDYYVKQVEFAGPYVAYSWEGVGAVDGGWYEIALFDLRRGVCVYGPIDPLSVSNDTIGNTFDGTGEAKVRDLVLKPNGSLAWTVDATGFASSQQLLLMREVWRLDSHGLTLLDHGEAIAPGSLTLKGSRLTWKRSGQAVSAPLR